MHAESKALPQKLGLAGLLGLVVGILLAAIAEMIRPTLPGSQRVSRRLDVPMLGRLIDPELRAQHEPDFASLALRVRLAASHADVSTVALVDVDVDGERDLAELARGWSMHWPLLRTTIGRRQLLRWRLTISMGTGTPPVAPDLVGRRWSWTSWPPCIVRCFGSARWRRCSRAPSLARSGSWSCRGRWPGCHASRRSSASPCHPDGRSGGRRRPAAAQAARRRQLTC